MKRFLKQSTFVVAILLLLAGTRAGADTEIALRDRVEITGSVVRLGDVADVSSADRKRGQELSSLLLMPAPAPGTQRFLHQREIADLLAAHGVALGELRFAGAAQVAAFAAGDGWKETADATDELSLPLNRHAALLAGQTGAPGVQPLDPARAAKLRAKFRRLIETHLHEKADQQAEWGVACEVTDRQLALLESATSPPVCQGGSSPWAGRQRFVVSFNTRDGMAQLPVYADITATSAPVVVAVRPLARGDVITAAHVELRNLDYVPRTTDRRATVDAVEKLIGMEVRQAIRAGEVVFTDQVQAPVLVQRGDLITVISQGAGIRIRTTARAREDGARGELVQVESLGTRERYDARVVGPREAAVFAVSQPAAVEPARRFDTARR